MAQKIQVQLVDDLDGSEAHDTVAFGLDGVSYEIDLSTGHAQELRSALEKFVASARKITGKRAAAAAAAPARTTGKGKSGHDLGAVRDWARNNGFEVSDRGRVAANVIAAFEAAN